MLNEFADSNGNVSQNFTNVVRNISKMRDELGSKIAVNQKEREELEKLDKILKDVIYRLLPD